MGFLGFYTTNKGNEYIARSMADQNLRFTSGKFGNGKVTAEINPLTLTDLVSPLGPLPISGKKTVGAQTIITTQFSNKVNGSILPPFRLTEAGIYGRLYNKDGTPDPNYPEVLLLYTYVTEDKSDYIQGVLTEFLLNWPLEVSAAANITVDINESLVYPTKEEYNKTAMHRANVSGTGKELHAAVDGVTLQDQTGLIVKLPEDLQDGATLSMNDETKDYPIKNMDGTPVKAGPIAGANIAVIFSQKDQCWYLIGGGGGSVEIATEEEAKAGIDNTKMMTPLRTKQYVDVVIGDINAILDEINGEII